MEYDERDCLIICKYKENLFFISDCNKPHKLIRIHFPYFITTHDSTQNQDDKDISYGYVSEEINLAKEPDLSESIVASCKKLAKSDLQSIYANAVNSVFNLVALGKDLLENSFKKFADILSINDANGK